MGGTRLNAVIWGLAALLCLGANAQDHGFDGGGMDFGGGGGGFDSGVSGSPSANDVANMVDRQYMDALAQKKSELAQAQSQLAQCAVDEARANNNVDGQLAQDQAQRAGQQAQNDGQNLLGSVLPSLGNLANAAFGSAGQQKKLAKESMDQIERRVADLNADLMNVKTDANRPARGVQVMKAGLDYSLQDVYKACADQDFKKTYGMYGSDSTGGMGMDGSNRYAPGYGAGYGYMMDPEMMCRQNLKETLQNFDNKYVNARRDYIAGSGMTTNAVTDAVTSVLGSIGNHAIQQGANDIMDNAAQDTANNQKQNNAFARQDCERMAREAIENIGKAIQQLDKGRGRALMDAALRSAMNAQQDKNSFNVAPNSKTPGAGGTINVGGPDSLQGAGAQQLANAGGGGGAGAGGPAGMAGGGGGSGGGGGADWTFPPGGAPPSGGPSGPLEAAQYEGSGGGGGGGGGFGGFGGDFGFGSDPNNFAMNKGEGGEGGGPGGLLGDGGINVLLNKMRIIMANHVGGENGLGMTARALASAKEPQPPKKKAQAALIQ